jgi:acetyltransferase-like isoleucine patch superfamily enzyme
MKLGKNTIIDSTVRFDWKWGKHITICDDVVLGDGVRIFCHEGATIERNGLMWVAPVYIGERAYIGACSVILPGVTIGADAVVAAGAVVAEDVKPGTIVAGTPAKQIGLTKDLDMKHVEMAKTKKSFPSDIAVGKSKAERAKIERDFIEAAEKDGGYFLIYKNKGNLP